MKSYIFLFWAYNVVWIGLAGWLLFVVLRLRRVERRIAAIEKPGVKT